MKKLFALLLIVCMLAGMVACGSGKPVENPTDPTGNAGGNPSNPTTPSSGTDVNLGKVPEKPEDSPYYGKTLQIYGLGVEEDYTDYDKFGKGNYLWMMKAAIEEWSALNGVEIVYEGSYNQALVLSSISAGGHPDIVFQTGNFPGLTNVGISEAFTAKERADLAAICGTDNYFSMMEYKGEAHGFVFPWSGVSMLYYNRTMFEKYEVKTPKEYFLEGQWNWTNFQKCLEETTKDLDSDGEIDTYGLPSDSFGRALFFPIKEDAQGNLLSRIDEAIAYDFFQMKYTHYTVKKTIQSPGKNQIQKNTVYPMTAMQIGDCEPYNFEHLYQTIANGDIIEAIPVPVYDGTGAPEKHVVWTDSCGHLIRACDEREAAVDLLAYLLRAGLKYISDYSLGSVKCEYDGILGACDLSAQWKEAFEEVCVKREAAIAKIDGYSAEHVALINEHLNSCTAYTHRKYADVSELISYKEIITMPPESAIPAIREKYQAQLNVYNDTYINN